MSSTPNQERQMFVDANGEKEVAAGATRARNLETVHRLFPPTSDDDKPADLNTSDQWTFARRLFTTDPDTAA